MKKTCAVIMFMFAVVTMCFALGTRRKLECSSEGYSWGYSHPSSSYSAPSYYSEEEKNAWKDGARRGQQDKKDKKDYDDPYMKQLQSSCVYD